MKANTDQLKEARRRMIAEHVAKIKRIDVEIAEQGRRERATLPGNDGARVFGLIVKWRGKPPYATDSEIASELNRRGIMAPAGRVWRGVTVVNWLNNYQREVRNELS